jgi:predicted nucleic acid-binding protein
MRLVDTSAWIEWLLDSPTGKRVAHAVPSRADWIVPTIIQLELAKWVKREGGEDKADQILAFTQLCRVVPLDTETALLAAEFCALHKLPTADAIVYATAQRNAALLVTCDAHFEGLEGVSYLPKDGKR